MQTLYTLADAYSGLGDVGASRAADQRTAHEARLQRWQQSISWYQRSAEIWQRVKEPGLISPDAFDCVPPTVVARRLSQAEGSLRKLSAN